MSSYIAVTWDGGGNAPPFLALVEELIGRGHTLSVISGQRTEDMWVSSGASFSAWNAEADFVATTRMPEAEHLPRIVSQLWFGASLVADVRHAVDRIGPVGLVIDQTLHTCGAFAEASGIPFAALYHSPLASIASATFRELHEAWLPHLNDIRAGLGVGPLDAVEDTWQAAQTRIVATAHAFDDDAATSDALYVGPLRPLRPGRVPPISDDERPLVVISFSTTWQDQIEPLQRVSDALSGAGVRPVVTLGDAVAETDLRPAAEVTVYRFLPHSDLFPLTDVVVTHAGHGTVMAALTAGVPMVCMPMGRDQHVVAGLVEACGAGLTISRDAPPGEISAAVHAVLRDPSYRDAARRMADTIATEPGVIAAADAIEALAPLSRTTDAPAAVSLDLGDQSSSSAPTRR